MKRAKLPGNPCLWQSWEVSAQKHPGRIVITEADTGKTFTAQELHAWAQELAARHFKVGHRGQIIAFCLPNEARWIAWFLAIQKAGAAALPLDPALPPTAQAGVAKKLGAHFLWKARGLTQLQSKVPLQRGACLIKSTSGSTGLAQALACLPRHLVADGRHILATMKIRSADVNLGLVPFGHSYGMGNLIMPLILQGTPIVCARAFMPAQIATWTQRHNITVFPSVPAVLRLLAESPSLSNLKPLRLVISAGAPLPPATARAFYEKFKIKIHNFYGASETGGICYDRTGNATLLGRGLGRPLEGVNVSIGKGKNQGAVMVKSAAVLSPHATQLLPDIGSWNSHGELVLHGRAGRLANIGGKKVAPAELEQELRALQEVSEAWITVFEEKGRDALAAAVESSQSAAWIEKSLARLLPAWKWPKRLHVARALPRNSRGKLDTAALRKILGISET